MRNREKVLFRGKLLIFLLIIMSCTSCNINSDVEDESQNSGTGSFEEAYVHSKEDFYIYDIKTDNNELTYAVIKGINDKYKDDFKKNYQFVAECENLRIPETLNGIPVKEIAANAFQNIDLGEYNTELEIHKGVNYIGSHAFENCGLQDVFIKGNDLTIDSSAFADNENLWAVYLGDKNAALSENIFEGCKETLYLCYEVTEEEQKDFEVVKENRLVSYAQTYPYLSTVEIPSYISEEPIIDYPETPLTLTPQIRNFFYGESADEDKFCSFEYADDAIDFGFPEWHAPCGEFCAMQEWNYEITASSELSSNTDSYAADHLKQLNKETVWAEGVSGNGIGESISITQSCGYFDEWIGYGTVYLLDGDNEPDIRDGYLRFTEICIVNGYAKSQKAWEENGRIKRLLMYVEDKPFSYLELEDTMKPQYFKLPIDAIKVFDGQEIHFKFVIEEVYHGTQYDDTCLTGLIMEFMGRRGH